MPLSWLNPSSAHTASRTTANASPAWRHACIAFSTSAARQEGEQHTPAPACSQHITTSTTAASRVAPSVLTDPTNEGAVAQQEKGMKGCERH